MKKLVYEEINKIKQFEQLFHAIFYHIICVSKVPIFRFTNNRNMIFQFFLEINDITDIEFNLALFTPYSHDIDLVLTMFTTHNWIKTCPFPECYEIRHPYKPIKYSGFYVNNTKTIAKIAQLFQLKLGINYYT